MLAAVATFMLAGLDFVCVQVVIARVVLTHVQPIDAATMISKVLRTVYRAVAEGAARTKTPDVEAVVLRSGVVDYYSVLQVW